MAGTQRVVDAVLGRKTTETKGGEWLRKQDAQSIRVALGEIAGRLSDLSPDQIDWVARHIVSPDVSPDTDTAHDAATILGVAAALLIDATAAMGAELFSLSTSPMEIEEQCEAGEGSEEVDLSEPIVVDNTDLFKDTTEPDLEQTTTEQTPDAVIEAQPEDAPDEGGIISGEAVTSDRSDNWAASYGIDLDELDAITDSNEALVRVKDLIGRNPEVSEGFSLDRAEVLISKLREQIRTSADIDDVFVEDIVRKYIDITQRSPMSIKIINSVCFVGYLKGVSVKDLRYVRSVTKPDARDQDVHNSRQAVIDGYQRWRLQDAQDRVREEARQTSEAFNDVIEHGFEVPSGDMAIATPNSAGEEGVIPHERPIDEEPRYIQLALRMREIVGLSKDFQAAAEELLNPLAKGAISENKQRILDEFRKKVVMRGEKGKNAIDALAMSSNSPPSVARVREFLGVFSRQGVPEQRAFRPISELVAKRTPLDQERMTQDFYNGLEMLLGILSEAESPADGEKPVKRVTFDKDGRPRLE